MKSKGLAYFLCIILGVFGVHRFYLGKVVSGILYLLTLGFFGIGVLVDLFTLSGQVDKYNSNKIGQSVKDNAQSEIVATCIETENASTATANIQQASSRKELNDGFPDFKEIRFDGTSDKLAFAYEFKNENGLPVLYGYSKTHLLFPEFSYCLDKAGYQTIMASKTVDGQTSVNQTLYDINNEILGKATINGSFARSFKVELTIQDVDGQTFLLSEDVSGLFTKIKKLIGFLIPSYGIGHLFDSRTQNMFIVKNGVNIGMIESIHGATRNTYIVRNCEALKKHIDLRLIIFSLTLKSSKVK